MRFIKQHVLPILLLATNANAQMRDADWEFEDPYDDQMLYLHALVNYSYDLQWQFDWERRQFVSNALRINTGSVSSTELLTDIDLNINQTLNDKWRFQGSFRRDGLRQRPEREDRLLVGFERSLFERSAVYLTVNPEFNKEFIDIAAGYTFYRDDRQQYVRVGALFEDVNYETKNDLGGKTEQNPVALQWAVRLGLANDWFVYSEGEVGSGFERLFLDQTASPDVSRHDRQSNAAQLRVSRASDNGTAWSAWVEWYDFNEVMQFRQPGFDYDYENTQLDFAVEHVRVLGDRHRLRLLVHYLDQKAESRGFNEHDYSRTDVLGGAFYEYLWPNSGVTFAYAFGQPDIVFQALDATESYKRDDYRDKLVVGWRYNFSEDAQIHVSVSHEVSVNGFGGGAVRFQLFF
ncbi:MAG: hypothetical protein WBM61_11385 [Woeseiaceae bacterium]